MKLAARFFSLLLLAGATAAAAEKESVITVFDQRKIGITVPAGFTLEHTEDPARGVAAAKISGRQGAIELNLMFVPDQTDGELARSARARKEFLVREFQEIVASSVEQAMQFEELDGRGGAGTFCAFTDASLVGKSPLPPNEFLTVTVGLKAWPGGFAVFRLFSNDTTSVEYRALLALLRESVQLKPVSPLK